MRTLTGTALAVLTASLLVGCATSKPVEYGPIGEKKPFGYQDRDNADGGHTVLVVMPPGSTPEAARGFWNRRAAEICVAGVSKSNIFRFDRREAFTPAASVYNGVGISSRTALAIQAEGYVYCTADAQPPAQTEANASAPPANH